MLSTAQSHVTRLFLRMGITLACVACQQPATEAPTTVSIRTSLPELLQRFRQVAPWDSLLPPPRIYQSSGYDTLRRVQYEIWLARQPLGLRSQVVQLHDPASRGKSYPVSYSVIYQQCLVALFAGGNFACFRLANFTRNQQLEKQLNTFQWQRHWLIDRQLIGLGKGQYYVFDQVDGAWHPYQKSVPFGTAPKLFEDVRYLVYSDCRGEFGGNAYFFNKQTRQTRHANASCAMSVWQENGQYQVLTSGLMGFVRQATIADPEVLPLAATPINDRVDWQHSSAQPERGVLPVFRYEGLQLFGGLRWQGQTVYLTHWRSTTFLATIAGKRLTIVDPLFSNELFTHEPVTVSYGPNLALTNLDFWGLGGKNEVAALLWQGQQLTKIEWGEQPRMRL